MTIRTPGWNTLPIDRAPRVVEKPDRFDELCFIVFGGGPGAELLDILRERNFNSHFNLDATEAAMRVRLTRQDTVLEFERAIARRRDALAKAAKKD